ncbi:MAG: phage tail protein [Treponema sp.]|nr:phage tail protein [Treponema sp.]
MSVKIIAQLHPLRSSRINITVSPKPISEIIHELNSGFPLSQARVCRNGEIITDFSLAANDGDTLTIKFVPYGTPQDVGVGMKTGGGIAFLAGLILAAGFGWTGIGLTVGLFIMGVGVSAVLTGVALMNMPAVKDKEKPEIDPSIRGGKNQARLRGRIPVLFGRHRIYPDLAANSHTEIIGDNQYFIQMFCGGYKDCVIDLNSVKLGETDIKEFSRTNNINSILSGGDSLIRLEILQNGESSKIYPHCVHEDMINTPLQNQIDGGDGSKIPGVIIKTTPDKTDKINVDIFFMGGLGKYNNDGDLVSASVTINACYKPAGAPDSAYQLLGYFSDESNEISGAELKTKRYQITRQGLAPGQYTIKLERETADSTDSKIIDQVYAGSIRSFKTTRPIREERQKDLTIITIRVMATAKLNGVIDSFNYVAESKLPVFSSNGTGPLYWLNTAETRNPAAMLMYALWGRPAQQTVDPDDIDWPSVEAYYLWCEERNYSCNAYISEAVTIAELIRMIGNTSRADILRIDSKITVVQDIERPARFQLFTPKNTISYSVTMFNVDIPDAISLRYIDEKSGYAQNELSVFNTPDGNQIKEPDTVQKVDLWGITDDEQVRRIGMYNYACLKNRPFVHTIEADIEYLVVNKGDWIQYAGDIALTGSVQGRIKGIIFADNVCVGIDTDEPVVMTAGQHHAVRIRLENGIIILKEVVYNPGIRREKSIVYYPTDESENKDLYEPFVGDLYAIDEEDNIYYEPQNVIFFIEPILKENAPKAGNIYAFGVRGYEAIDLIITDIQPGQNSSAVLTCVEYSPEIFNVDKPGFILPEFVNRVTPVSGAMDSGVVNSNKWLFFAVYHDNEDEPPRPSADGQNGGWYREQTFRSVWQASKTAVSIESGEWGHPVRIKAQRGTDDITPIWLGLTPQNILLDTDGDGNILAGLLPINIQARLFRWNSLLENAAFSLVNAPAGVSIDSNGLIIITIDAMLGDNNKITVRAEYQNAVYTTILTITKNLNRYAPRYLGTVKALSETAVVSIITGPIQGHVQARQGDFVLAIYAVANKLAGSVFQWTGSEWKFRAPDTHVDLYMRCFKDGLDVPELTQDMGWFGALFARMLIAQRAFIEELQVQLIQVKGALFGGERFTNSNGQLIDLGSSRNGFCVAQDGIFKASGVDISGRINATSGKIGGVTLNNETITVDGRAYVPKGYIYFRLRGRPRPSVLYTGVWHDISSQYAGLFFRVKGGNAADFEKDQAQSIQSHRHVFADPPYLERRYQENNESLREQILFRGTGLRFDRYETEYTGSAETRPVNTTIEVWEKYAEDWE